MNFLDLQNIKTIQLDHTSRCNLACPQCARTVNPISKKDLTINDYKIILEPFDSVKFFHCGNYGDALASPTFDETYDFYIDKISQCKIATNGSLRTKDWWHNFAKKSNKNVVVFSIDGLHDTNAIYRINSDFDKIISNASSYINAGGNAEWHFIVFEHNHHQVDEARKLSIEMGFNKFKIKYSTRELMAKVDTKDFVKVSSKIHKKKIKSILSDYKSFVNYTKETDILCKAKLERKVFIDYDMNLMPCCWFGAHDPPAWRQMEKVFDKYGKEFYNLRKYGWNVLEHQFYQNHLYNSWKNIEERIYTCGRTCGRQFQSSSGYGQNINEI